MIKNHPLSVIAILSALAVICCNDAGIAPPQAPVSGKMNFGVLRYDSAALEYRLDSIHNRGLILQFCLTEAGNNNTAFQAISYAYDTMGDHNNSWMPDTLRLIQDSTPKTFSGKLTLGNNEVTREQLYDILRDDNGNRFSYDYMLLTPVVEGVFNHVVYKMKPMKGSHAAHSNKDKMQMSTPMPPSRVW
jgi:hypothetical protein